MATRFYLPSSGDVPESLDPDKPDYTGSWDNTASASRLPMFTSKQSSSMTSVGVSGDSDTSDLDYLVRQWISEPVNEQTIGSSLWSGQIRALEDAAQNNLFVSVVIKVVSNDGTSLTGTLVSLTRDDTEMNDITLTNRTIGGFIDGSVDANANDRVVIEIGFGGDPTPSGDHDGSISIGDDSGTDLPSNDSETSAYNPWIEIDTTISFVGAAGNPPTGVIYGPLVGPFGGPV